MKLKSVLLLLSFLAPNFSFAEGPPDLSEKAPLEKSKTEGEFCITCETKALAGNPHTLAKLQDSSDQITIKLSEVKPPPGLEKPQHDPGSMKRHIARVKARTIKKIQSAPCPRPDDDEDFDGFEDRRPSMSGALRGGPPGGDEMRDPEINNLLAMDLEFQDDLQDAMDAKEERCKKEMSKKRPSRQISAGALQMGPTQQKSGGFGSSLMGVLGGMGQMMGGGMMGGGMGMGMNPYMMGSYGMSSYGMSMMSPYSMGYYGLNSMSPYMMGGYSQGFGMYGPMPRYSGYGF